MSALAKVFVVLNLLLSLLFFGTSATLFLTRTNLQRKLTAAEAVFAKTKADLTRKIDGLTTAINLQDRGYQRIETSERNLGVELVTKIADLERKTTEKDLANAGHRAAEEQLATIRTQLTENERTITGLRGEVQSARESQHEALETSDQATKNANRRKRDLDLANRELSNQKKEHITLVDRYEALEIRWNSLVAKAPELVAGDIADKPIDARIEAVDRALEAVVLSVGRDQDVKQGSEFVVYRGRKFVGKVIVVRLYRDMAGAKVLFEQDGERIRVGDRATTRLNSLGS
ncbi:MAG: hypothetical protein O7J95_18840 [Planctomycetota bacterium]|nr:hypothetical protein [Planctomycetota bacterium]